MKTQIILGNAKDINSTLEFSCSCSEQGQILTVVVLVYKSIIISNPCVFVILLVLSHGIIFTKFINVQTNCEILQLS